MDSPTSSAGRCARGAGSRCCSTARTRSGERRRAAAPRRGRLARRALARYAPLVERCEQDHDQVLMVCGGGRGSGRVGGVLHRARRPRDRGRRGGPAPEEGAGRAASDERRCAAPTCSRTACGRARASSRAGCGCSRRAASSSSPDGEPLARRRRADGAPARRALASASCSAAAARAPSPISGCSRCCSTPGCASTASAGVSMGAFVGGLLACGHDSAAIDAACYEEWVRRNPINDYTIPRHGLISGHKAKRCSNGCSAMCASRSSRGPSTARASTCAATAC